MSRRRSSPVRNAGAGLPADSSRPGQVPLDRAVGSRPRGRSGRALDATYIYARGRLPEWSQRCGGRPASGRCRRDRRGDRVATGPIRGCRRPVRSGHRGDRCAQLRGRSAAAGRVAIAGDTGIGDSLPRSHPTFAVWSNLSMLAMAFAFRHRGRDDGGRVRPGP